MKTLFCAISLIYLFSPLNAFCETEQEKAISEFEEKVGVFTSFFQTHPKILEKQESSKSPSKYIHFYN